MPFKLSHSVQAKRESRSMFSTGKISFDRQSAKNSLLSGAFFLVREPKMTIG
jgi:hypothetical protein